MGSYKITDDAQADLDRIWRRGLKEWDEAQADKYYNAFFDRFELLAEQPYLYPTADYIREGYRKSVCGVDTIYYRVVGETVEIMNVLGRQDRDEWL
jgi:toxin ParE1/3/4